MAQRQKKIRDSGVNPYVILTASGILSAEHQKLQQLSKGRVFRHVCQP